MKQIQLMTAAAVAKTFGLNRQKVDVGTMHDRNTLDDIVEDFEKQIKDLLDELRLKDLLI